eukprot:1462603-Amphidinium_carterae.1
MPLTKATLTKRAEKNQKQISLCTLCHVKLKIDRTGWQFGLGFEGSFPCTASGRLSATARWFLPGSGHLGRL